MIQTLLMDFDCTTALVRFSINKEIRSYGKNLDIKIKSFKIFKIDKKLNTATIHVYY